MRKLTIEYIENNNLLLYSYIRGSKLYGINLPSINDEEVSDTDIGGVFLCDTDQCLGLGFDYCEQVQDEKGDKVYYELGRFLKLALESNPNILEAFYIPKDKVIGNIHPYMQDILNVKEMFLTKLCLPKFKGYAYNQIKKAKSLNKKINYEKPLIRKGVLDFCFTMHKQGTQHIVNWLNERGLKQKYCGIVSLNNMTEMYAVYYDWGKHFLDENVKHEDFINENNIEYKKLRDYIENELFANNINMFNKQPIGYRGITSEEIECNEVRCSSVEPNIKPICYMSFQKMAYSTHCKDYIEYVEWDKNKNPHRFKQNVDCGMKMDLKNMTHCVRLLQMCYEIVTNKGVLIDRTNIDREFLLEIRTGKKTYEEIVNWANDMLMKIEQSIPNCTLPETIDVDFVNQLLINIRKKTIKHF